jgi:uridine kinase
LPWEFSNSSSCAAAKHKPEAEDKKRTVVIIEGFLLLSFPEIVQQLDLKIFIQISRVVFIAVCAITYLVVTAIIRMNAKGGDRPPKRFQKSTLTRRFGPPMKSTRSHI